MKNNIIRDISMRFPGGREKALTFSYDDGVIYDEKLSSILNAHKMKGTFNVNSEFLGMDKHHLTKEKALEVYKGHEVSVHGTYHADFTSVPTSRAVCEMIEDRINLEKCFNTIVRGMAYPYGTYNDEIVSAAKSCGIVYSRTTKSTHSFNLPENWLTLHPTCHHNDGKLMELAKQFVELKSWRGPQMFYLWGHSYEFNDNNNWNIIEEFTDFMADRDDIWYATNMEIYNAVKAYESLIYSADGTRIENPTLRDVWICTYDEVKKIPSGEIITL